MQPPLESHSHLQLPPSATIQYSSLPPFWCHGHSPGADPGAAAAGQGAKSGEAAGGPEAANPAAEEMGRVREGDAKQEAEGGQEEPQRQQPAPVGEQAACVVCCQRGSAGGFGQERPR